MDAVFAAIARTHSPAGAQVLYRALREPRLETASLDRRDDLIDALTEDPEVLLDVREALTDDDQSWMVPDVLWEPLPRLPLGVGFFWGLRAVALAAVIVGIGWWPPAFLFLIAALGTNVVVGLWLEQRIEVFGDALIGLAATIRVARRVAAALPDSLAERRAALLEWLRRARPIERRAGLITMGDPTELTEFFQRLLGAKPLAYSSAVDLIEREVAALRALYLEVGEIDAAISIAWLRAERGLTIPDLETGGEELELEAAVHPLVGGAVANDAALAPDRGLLITGSNMSGKTTYLKTVAVNAICAQSIHAVFAAAHRGPLLRVATSIDRLDDLEDNQSYFMAEALSVQSLLEVAAAGPSLVVIDELFRGTNPADRLAAGVAVLDYLGPRALVAIATHDAELGDRVASGYVEHHFLDRWSGTEMSFDYRLRRGRSPRSNAIELLADIGYPREIIESAERHRRRAAV